MVSEPDGRSLLKVYTYVIATDAGGAPNYAPPCLTLAICKPRIRRGAKPGDLVLAFNGARLSTDRNGVRWAGIVSEKFTFMDYWHDDRFATKKPNRAAMPDNIYEPIGGDFRQVPNPAHSPVDQSRDLGGEFVLAFADSWYFGNQAPELPAKFGLRMLAGRRGHRVAELSEADWADLRRWLDTQVSAVPVLRSKPCGPSAKKPAKAGRC
jgi:hypothetical protein